MSDRELAIRYIESLSDKKLAEFFYEAMKNRREFNEYEDGYSVNTFSLASSYFATKEGEEVDLPDTNLIGLPTAEMSKLQHIKTETVLSEFGSCDYCGTDVLSVAKVAICPICSKEVECT